jgi:Tfp pilus assembly protein PilF
VNLGLATTLEAMSRPQEALAAIERALRNDPAYAAAYHFKASLLMKLDRYPEAYATFRDGLAIQPADGRLLSGMGLYYLRDGSPDSASKYLEKAVEVDSSLLSAHGNLALAYEDMGLRSKAAEQYRKYIAMAPPGRAKEMAVRALMELESIGNGIR